jgi:predicted acylesterase/phospholipase RssA
MGPAFESPAKAVPDPYREKGENAKRGSQDPVLGIGVFVIEISLLRNKTGWSNQWRAFAESIDYGVRGNREGGSMATTGASGASAAGKLAAGLPKKICDLVMKGGVTSGVVYPKAITELSKEYQFSSIGGTSAGAIAAAVAAAAEYARAGGKLGAFEELTKLPVSLGETSADGNSMLFHLFQPQAALSGVFGVAMAGLGKSGVRKWLATLLAALKASPFAAVLGLAAGLLVAWVAGSVGTDGLRLFGIALGILIAIVGLLLGLVFGVGVEVARIPKNGWGICSGMMEGLGAKSPALVPWLASYLDKMAGKRVGEPLTFGDLQQRGVKLQIITTNLTTGRPYTMPFDEHTHFYFKGAELRRFFPEYVVKCMESNPGTRSSRDLKGDVASGGLSVLPDALNLPVIVAVRMSLSFPFLFCPVPFYGVDFGFGPKTADGKHVPEPTLFVDGGMTSNFPLNLFDKPLPRWPTFGINLREKDDGRHFQDIYMACTNGGGLEEWWTRFDEGAGWGGLFSYFSLLFDTSRNWRDNLQMNVPGYRDRVVHIGLNAQEGGMNLDMEKTVIAEIAARGQKAGAAILSRYSPSPANPADPDCVVDLANQKWIRFRSFMELLEEVSLSMEKAVAYSGFGEATYEYLLQESAELSYSMTASQREYAGDLLRRFMDLVPLVKAARAAENSFNTRVPKPEPDLKVTPHF